MTQPKLIPTHDNKYVLLENYKYKDVIVPKGFITNGADVPRLLWNWMPPFKPKFMAAVVIHDYLTELGNYKKADSYFKELLYNTEKSFTTFSMWLGVRIYHKIRYGK
jgi:hypothetical protein